MQKTPGVGPEEIAERCRKYIVVAGGPREWNDTRESWLARAAWRLGISPARAATLFYRKIKTIPAHEYETLRLQVASLERAAERRREALNELDRKIAALDRWRGGQAELLGDADSGSPAGPEGAA